MSALERAVATANELMKKLNECSDLASTIASTMDGNERAVRKFDDVTLAIWTIMREVEEYDFYSKR